MPDNAEEFMNVNKKTLCILAGLAIVIIIGGGLFFDKMLFDENRYSENSSPESTGVTFTDNTEVNSGDSIESSDWIVYRNEYLGVELKYPKNFNYNGICELRLPEGEAVSYQDVLIGSASVRVYTNESPLDLHAFFKKSTTNSQISEGPISTSLGAKNALKYNTYYEGIRPLAVEHYLVLHRDKILDISIDSWKDTKCSDINGHEFDWFKFLESVTFF
ncbi:MAG: hypothetical protein HY482_01560 [Candidatus Wildermuthbacteria bacterium]|nr:hypothetical protein [Candidatus Wildermuthbacteria bacterium]